MSREELATGLEVIKSYAERFDLRLGSKHEDSFRGVIRLSLEANVSIEGRQALRAQIVELSREFVEDLPASKDYQAQEEALLAGVS